MRSSSGEDAIRALAAADTKDPYQLVLMDWHMPGMDGLQASAIIKREGRLKNVPRIVMVTAFGREEIRVTSRADRYRRVPAEAGECIGALRHHDGPVRRRRSAKSRARSSARASPPSYDARGVRVLLVEDNELNQQVATELLESAGAIVTVAANGRSLWICFGTDRSRRHSTSC